MRWKHHPAFSAFVHAEREISRRADHSKSLELDDKRRKEKAITAAADAAFGSAATASVRNGGKSLGFRTARRYRASAPRRGTRASVLGIWVSFSVTEVLAASAGWDRNAARNNEEKKHNVPGFATPIFRGFRLRLGPFPRLRAPCDKRAAGRLRSRGLPRG